MPEAYERFKCNAAPRCFQRTLPCPQRVAASCRVQNSCRRCMQVVCPPAAVAAALLRRRQQLRAAQPEGPHKWREAVQRRCIRCEQGPRRIAPPREQVIIRRQPQQKVFKRSAYRGWRIIFRSCS